MRPRSALWLCPLILTACAGEPTGPPGPAFEGVPLAARVPRADPVRDAVIADAIDRLLPALDPATAANLGGPLRALQSQLQRKTGDPAALKSAIAAAEAGLAAPLAANDERAPDLVAIALALVAVK